MVNQISAGSVYKDSMIYFRDILTANLTDPISPNRASTSSFVATSFPQRLVVYPLVIVKDGNMTDNRVGLQSEISLMEQDLILTIYARNVSERDGISQQIYNVMRTNQYGTGSEFTNFGWHDYRLVSSINIQSPNEEAKETGVRTKQMIYKFFTVIQP